MRMKTEMTNDPVYVVAKWDYTAKQDEELTIKKNERLELTDDSRSWWKVKKTSGDREMGYVPSNYVKREKLGFIGKIRQKTKPHKTSVTNAPDPVQVQRHQSPQNTDVVSSPKIAVVKFKYEPQQEDELALNKGDKVIVIEKCTDGWWKGEVSGKSGWFPSNYVSEDLDRSSASSKGEDVSSSVSSGEDFLHGVMTLYPFQGRNSEELNFDQGERLDIIELPDNDPEWWRARNKEGRVGLVPRNYVQVISDAIPVYSRLPYSNGDNGVEDGDNQTDSSREDLSGKEWFHGKLSRAQSESVLQSAVEGNFLVRESEAFRGDFSISVKGADRVKHFKVHVGSEDSRFLIGQKKFDNLDDIVAHYKNHPIFTNETTRLFLTNPLPLS
ncbi:cytoplasmic protein NCK2-like isoform X2 [Apostichopus japonicus]|uniref:cytoplasmic protein NCK2-like isoform X2 n=1 Tax=Stichopus japonicus TaxID=307972 RepID=UPI003AB2FFA1